MIHLIVNKQKAIMCLVEPLYTDNRILSVVAVNIQLKLIADTLRADRGRHSFCSFIKQSKHGIIHIVVYQHYGLLRFSHQTGNKTICVKYLSVIEYALRRRIPCIQTLEDLVNTFVGLFLTLLHLQLVILDSFKPPEQLVIGRNETAH